MSSEGRRVVIGLGTGRSGTHSLAALLARQPDTVSLHQPPPCLPWQPDFAAYRDVHELITSQQSRVVALVAWYYLPYGDVLVRDHDARFVCLQRDRSATIASVSRLTEGIDNWSNRPLEESATTRFRRLFPQFDVDVKEEAIGLYWDRYHELVDQLAGRHPGRVLTLPTEALNDPDQVDRILDFAGYGPDRVSEAGIREGRLEGYRWRGDGR